MVEFDLDLPPGWSKRAAKDQQEHPMIEYQWARAEDTMFIVALLRCPTDTTDYRLQLSTITSQSITVRHDYFVREYDTQAAALNGMEAFIETSRADYATDQFPTRNLRSKRFKRRLILLRAINRFLPFAG